MLRSIKLGKAFGIPLFINPTFLLLPAWVLFNHRGADLATSLFLVLWVAAVFSCVLLHELGHALMARCFGIGTHDITLYPIGGVARLERMSERPAEEFAIALAGPAVNVVIAALLTPVGFYYLLNGVLSGDAIILNFEEGPLVLLARFLTLLWLSNVFLVLFNLIPAFPMDGGRVLRALLSAALGRLRATEAAAAVGLVLSALMGLLTVVLLLQGMGNVMLLAVALFVGLAGQQELRAVRRVEARRRAEALGEALPVRRVQPASAAVEVVAEGPAPAGANFSGLAWDPESRAWVFWENGRRVWDFRAHAE